MILIKYINRVHLIVLIIIFSKYNKLETHLSSIYFCLTLQVHGFTDVN